MKFLDLFAGIGGFRLGLELAGHECAGFCEIDRFAAASYISMHLITDAQRNYLKQLKLRDRQKEILKKEYRNGEWYAKNITELNGRDIPASDCWTFGAPCQDFSIAGKRAGLDGKRSSLVGEVFRLLDEREEKDKPEWLIYENVKGMLSSNRGLDYLTILSEMDKRGYDIEWQNINSSWFVPQNRERIYTIGHLRRCGRRKVLPVQGTSGKTCSIVEKSEKFCDLTRGEIKVTTISRCIAGRYNRGLSNRKGESSGVVIPVLTPERTKKRQNGRRFKESGEPSFTLTSQDNHGVAINIKEATKKGYAIAQTLDASCNQGIFITLEDGNQIYAVWYEKEQCYIAIRKLTPRECFRLQGWTDDYFDKAEFVNSNNQLYKQAGNGVTVDVVKRIGERIGTNKS